MKRFISLFLFFVIVFNSNIAISAQYKSNAGVISSRAQVSKEFKPEIAIIVLAVETTNINSQKAANENKKITNNVFVNLKSLINKQKGDCIKTINYSLNPHYSYHDKERKLDYYKVINQIKVETTKINNVGKFIDMAVNHGANKIVNIYYKLKDPDPNYKGLLRQASIKAKSQASDIAEAMGAEIVGIKEVNYNCSANNYFIKSARYASIMRASQSNIKNISTPIEKSSIKLHVTVNAKFYIGEMK